MSVAADNNRFYNPVLLFSDQQTKFVNKPYWSLCPGFCSPYTLDLSVSERFPREGWARAKDDRKLTLVTQAIHLLPSLLCLYIQLSGTQIGVPHDGRKAKKKKKKTAANWTLDNTEGRGKKYKKIYTPWDSLLSHCFFKLVRSSNYAVFLLCRNCLFQIIWGEDIPLYSITWLIQKPKAQRHVSPLQRCPPYPCWNTDTTETESKQFSKSCHSIGIHKNEWNLIGQVHCQIYNILRQFLNGFWAILALRPLRCHQVERV